MNLPDFTLFLQMVHFLIVYLILYKLVFAPALELLVKEEKYTKNLHSKIDVLTQDQALLVANRDNNWQKMKKRLIAGIPVLSKVCPVLQHTKMVETTKSLAPSEKNTIVSMIKNKLMDIV